MPKTVSKFQRAFELVSLIYVVGFTLLLGFRPGSPATFEMIFDVCEILPHIVGGICCCLYAQRGRHTTSLSRIGWLLIGLSCFAYLLGDIIWVCYTTTLGNKVPYPSWADLAWLSVFPLQLAGILLLFGSIPNTGRIRMLLDSAIVAGSIGALSWYFLGAQIWHQSGMTLFAKIVSVTYPLCDIAVLFGVVALLNSLSDGRGRLSIYKMLAAGLVIWASADTIYTFVRFHNTFRVGDWFQAGWPFGALLIGYAAVVAQGRGQAEQSLDVNENLARHAAKADTWWRLAAPYLMAGVTLATIFTIDYIQVKVIRNSTVLLCLGIVLLVMLRQVFVLLENRHLLRNNRNLMEQLRTTNEELEIQKAQLEQTNQKLTELATKDGLTGLNNHRAFQEKLAAEFERTQRYASPLSLVLLDVDKFKKYNDSFGHPEGDLVLKTVAAVLQSAARETDYVCRYGGEEFVIVLPNTHEGAAVAAAERFRAAIEAHAWPLSPVNASFGVSTLYADLTTAQELIAQADKALYISKSEGRNRVTHASTLNSREAREELFLLLPTT